MTPEQRGNLVWIGLGAGCLLLLGVGCVVAGAISLPPVLNRWILIPHTLSTTQADTCFYLISASFFAIGVAALLRARRWLVRREGVPLRLAAHAVATVVLSTTVTLALLELGLRLAGESDLVLSPDEFWFRLRLERLSKDGAPGTFNPFYASDRYDPDLGWVPVAGYRSDELTTNARGLRGKRDHPYAKPPGERRIVVVGDSFTFGEDVADAEVYTEVLDGFLNDVRVVNLGVHGWGSDQQYIY